LTDDLPEGVTMPLFECEQCHCVDNTALTNFWQAHIEEKPQLCSACDPEIGKWHDKFPRIPAAEYTEKYPKARKVEYPAKGAAQSRG